jgi:aspartyl-tRNA(Asn)/glutamyl-tRNA(Gln) amidotransferase subunit B
MTITADTEFEPVIGLEVHAQLLTATKLFCGCSTAFGAPPNTNVCEVCTGMPGVLPVLNAQAVELATRAGFGLNCTVHDRSQWSRKNYFYPDLPKGYQISQYDKPICTGGKLDIDVDGVKMTVGITRIHMEEDAGKNVHDDMAAGARSYVDFNRSSIPLIEIVSEPDIRSSVQAAAYMKAMRQLLRYLGVCDGNMEEGSLRCDANVSVRPKGEAKFGTRAEIKNINSFRFVQQAIDFEIDRQVELIRVGGKVVQETRLWDSQAKTTRSMRSKEEAHDYRYFPEPDLPDLVLKPGFRDEVKTRMPELPATKLDRYVSKLSLSPYDAKILTEDPEVAHFFDAALAQHNNAKAVANWVINEVLRELKGKGIASLPFAGAAIGELVQLIDDNTISGKIAKDVFAEMMTSGGSAKAIVDAKGWKQVTDTGAIEPIVDAVLAANAESVEKYKAGKQNVIGFLVGLVMKESKGKANPAMVNTLLKKKLEG